jgi:hypothetical protein
MSSRYQRSSRVEMAPLESETILLDTENEKFCHLNATASYLWGQLGEPVTAEELARQLAQRFAGITQAEALRDVNEVLQQLLLWNFVAAEPLVQATAG